MATMKFDEGFMPGYFELVYYTYNSFTRYFSKENVNCNWIAKWYEDLQTYAVYSRADIIFVCLLAVLWTVMRASLSSYIFVPFASSRLEKKNAEKFPESAWKFLYYTTVWSFCVYIVIFSGKHAFFHEPLSVWHSWDPKMTVPIDIYLLYMMQCSFYMHSLYATLFMDTWRKDSLVMLFHHFLTLALIAFSFAFRYHRIGVLVLMLHDVTDVELEFTKLNTYFRYRKGKKYMIHEHLANCGFVFFAVSWFVFRLYWFPLKVLFAASQGVNMLDMRLPFFFFHNVLLWIIQILNIYWFTYIVVFLYKVATGQINELDDTREYDALQEEQKEQERQKLLAELTSQSSDKLCDKLQLNGLAGGHVTELNGISSSVSTRPKKE